MRLPARPRCRTAAPAGFARCGRSGGAARRRADADLDASPDLRRARDRRLVPGPARRAPGPARPQRVAGQGARRPARPARPVVPRRPGHRHDGAPDVPPGRAVPDALRRGLPRPDRDRVPPGLALRAVARHLRVDPPAPRQVHHGGRARPVGRGRRRRHERARRARRRVRGRAAPRDPSAPGQRAGERSTSRPGREIRTYDLATRQLVSVVPAEGSSALADRRDGPTSWSSASTTAASRRSTWPASASAAWTAASSPCRLGTVDHPITHLLVTDDGAAVVAASTDRLTLVDMADGSVSGTLDLAGIAGLAPGGTGAALVADIDEVEDAPSAAAKLADILSGDARRSRVEAHGRLARDDGRPGQSRGRRRSHGPRHGDRRRRPAGRAGR